MMDHSNGRNINGTELRTRSDLGSRVSASSFGSAPIAATRLNNSRNLIFMDKAWFRIMTCVYIQNGMSNTYFIKCKNLNGEVKI
jgi:hypothetical protein